MQDRRLIIYIASFAFVGFITLTRTLRTQAACAIKLFRALFNLKPFDTEEAIYGYLMVMVFVPLVT